MLCRADTCLQVRATLNPHRALASPAHLALHPTHAPTLLYTDGPATAGLTYEVAQRFPVCPASPSGLELLSCHTDQRVVTVRRPHGPRQGRCLGIRLCQGLLLHYLEATAHACPEDQESEIEMGFFILFSLLSRLRLARPRVRTSSKVSSRRNTGAGLVSCMLGRGGPGVDAMLVQRRPGLVHMLHACHPAERWAEHEGTGSVSAGRL